MFMDTADNEQRMVPSRQDQNGAFLIDRSPTYFEPLLNYLRHGEIILDANVNVEGVFFAMFKFNLMTYNFFIKFLKYI